MSKIYIIHQTNEEFMNDILDSKKLLPASKTKNKSQNPYDVDLPYIFMNCCKKSDFKYYYNINFTFIFDTDILHDRTWYTNVNHSAGNLDTSICYNKNTSVRKINTILTKLYKKSKAESRKFFVILQEIFFRKSVSLDDAKYIIIPENTTAVLIDKIKKVLPNVILI
jgi:hypothetical protein